MLRPTSRSAIVTASLMVKVRTSGVPAVQLWALPKGCARGTLPSRVSRYEVPRHSTRRRFTRSVSRRNSDGNGMFFDHFVSDFPSHPSLHGRHEDLCRR